jgi:tetratricopeptide (TPR) repeat protein
LYAALLAGGVAVLGFAGWWTWRAVTAPVPPAIPRDAVDASLADLLEAGRRQVERAPYTAAAWGELGKLFRDCTLLDRAAACFREAERLEPHEPRWPYLQGEALRLHDPEGALPPLQRAAALCDQVPVDTIAPRLRLAELLLALGSPTEAKEQLDKALAAEPDDPSVHYNLGLVAYAGGDFAQARASWLRCQHSPYTRQKATAQLAMLAEREGDTRTAAELSGRARGLANDLLWPDPYRTLSPETLAGKAARFDYLDRLQAQKRYAEAVAILRDMQAGGPDYRVAAALGQNLAELGQVQEGEQDLRTAIDLAPESVLAHYYLSKVLWTQAEQRWRELGSLPASADKDSRRREILDQYRAAAEHARQALSRKPDHGLAAMILGLCQARLGEREAALASLHQAVQCRLDLVEPALYLGQTLAEYGQLAEARTYLEQAQRLAQADDPRPRAALERLKNSH